MHSRLGQPVVNNECAGMCFETVLNVLFVVYIVCGGVFGGSCLSIVLKRFNKDKEEPVLTYGREAGSFLFVLLREKRWTCS